MANPNWCAGFSVSKATHKEVKKSAAQLEQDRKQVELRRRAEESAEHKAQLKEWGLI